MDNFSLKQKIYIIFSITVYALTGLLFITA